MEHTAIVSGHALVANPALTIMDFALAHGEHSTRSCKQLITKGLVTGVSLNYESKAEPCDACTYVKIVHQPIPKEH